VSGYADVYDSLLPATFLPSWSAGACATCALLAQDRADEVRVIGMAHSDGESYYRHLSYYEPIIHAFVAVSEEIGEKLSGIIPHRQDDIEVRPYAVAAPRTLSRAYATPGEPVRLLYAGRIMQDQKRVLDLPALAAELDKRDVDFTLRIVGDGRDKRELAKHIARLGTAAERVQVEPAVRPDEMPGVWQSADVCVLVSDYEGTSISMLEAMANGCVPVVTRVSGAAGVIREGENGRTMPVGDLAAMAETIGELAGDRDRLARMGAAAHADIRSGYSYDEYVQWFEALVARVRQMSPRPWPVGHPLLVGQAADYRRLPGLHLLRVGLSNCLRAGPLGLLRDLKRRLR
jgi:glycosyltransferase involved in cell wall biosynthesis